LWRRCISAAETWRIDAIRALVIVLVSRHPRIVSETVSGLDRVKENDMKNLGYLAALTALFAGSAWAADLPTHKAPMEPAPYAAPAFSWTGFYIGANAGYSFSEGGATSTTGSPAFAALGPNFVPGSLDTKGGGFIGGGQIGYNYQFGTFVTGLEADIDWVDQRKSASFTGAVLPAPLGTSLTTSASRNLNYLGTVRGRLGVTPFDRTLLFITGGLAYGGVQTSNSVVANANPALNWNGSTDSTRVGWTLGGGGEYAFTNNVTFKIEGLYYDLGKTSTVAPGNAAVQGVGALNGVFYSSQVRTAGEVVRAGVNFKF
jgi:outer membrane immunogenic protein